MLGKITVINTLVVSQLVYYFMNTYSPTEQFYNDYENRIKKFLLGEGPARIKFSVLKLGLQEGGLKLVDVRKKCQALKIKWLKLALTGQTFGQSGLEKF